MSSWSGRLLIAVMILAGLCVIGASLGEATKATETPPLATSAEESKQLPPGLAKKPANHPGRMKHMQHANPGKAQGKAMRHS